jgi:acyl carrier protein
MGRTFDVIKETKQANISVARSGEASSALMREENERLIRCFSSIFPKLTRDQIRTANVDSLLEWDSLAFATLIAVIEEEFETQIDTSDAPDLSSFESVEQYLRQHNIFA